MGHARTEERQPIVVQEVRYYVLPPDAIHELPFYRPRRHGACMTLWTILAPVLVFISCLLLAASAFRFWPVQPEVELQHWRLNGIAFDTKEAHHSIVPVVYINVSLDVVLQIENPNFVGIEYEFLQVEVLYRGSYLGDAKLRGGLIMPRDTVLVPAVLNLEAKEILESAADLLADLARGEVPLTTHIKIVGNLEIRVVRPHIDVNLECDVVVDPRTKLIIREFCDLDIFDGTQLRRRVAPSSVQEYKRENMTTSN